MAEPAAVTTEAPTPTVAPMIAPTLQDIERARERVADVIEVTPVQQSRSISEFLGSEVLLKCENLQRTGSYKLRGAYNRLAQLSDDEKARGVVAASAGNHAQGVALAARELGIPATIFMPLGVALPKLQATRGYGAAVELRGRIFDETLAAAIAFTEETGAVFIPPFDHPDVIAGQGTLGLEILEQVPDVDTIIVPIGGGGLAAGLAIAVKQKAAIAGRSVRVIGVQSANAAAFPVSIAAGVPTQITIAPTIADGIAVAKPGALTFDIIRDTLDDIVTVHDDDTARALVVLLERAKLVVEPAGAVGVAAIMTGQIAGTGRTVVILSGGNIDPMMMERVISHGLAASDRYLKLRIPLPDRPGQLAQVSRIVSDANANVLEVLHTRRNVGLQISQVELELHLETRGPEHTELVLDRLRAEGFEPRWDF